MANVYKEITGGADLYGTTTAVGELEFVRRTGFMSCGSGDDYTLKAKERKLVDNHDPKDGDLNLPDGRMN